MNHSAWRFIFPLYTIKSLSFVVVVIGVLYGSETVVRRIFGRDTSLRTCSSCYLYKHLMFSQWINAFQWSSLAVKSGKLIIAFAEIHCFLRALSQHAVKTKTMYDWFQMIRAVMLNLSHFKSALASLPLSELRVVTFCDLLFAPTIFDWCPHFYIILAYSLHEAKCINVLLFVCTRVIQLFDLVSLFTSQFCTPECVVSFALELRFLLSFHVLVYCH